VRASNPVGRGRRSPGVGIRWFVARLVPRLSALPWIPSEAQWGDLLAVGSARVAAQPGDARLGLRRGACGARSLCSLRTDDLDPAHRTLRVRAETTKTRRERVVPYSAATGVLLSGYLEHRAKISRGAAGPCSCPNRDATSANR